MPSQSDLIYIGICYKRSVSFEQRCICILNVESKLILFKKSGFTHIGLLYQQYSKVVEDRLGVINKPGGQEFDFLSPPTNLTWTSTDILITTNISTYPHLRGHLWTHPSSSICNYKSRFQSAAHKFGKSGHFVTR